MHNYSFKLFNLNQSKEYESKRHSLKNRTKGK